MPLHSADDNPHRPFVVDASDPGTIGARRGWLNPTTRVWRLRSGADDGWEDPVALPTVRTEATAAYTLQVSDIGAHLRLNDATGVVLTVPKDATLDLPIGTTVTIEQVGAGPVSVEPEDLDPAIIAAGDATETTTAGAVAHLRKVAADEWVLWGDLAAGGS